MRLLISFVFLVALTIGGGPLWGQEPCVNYQLIPQTTYRQTPVKVKRWTYDTVVETRQVTEYKPVWRTEQRERRTTVMKPVTRTSTREDRYTVRKPITETKFRERTYQQTVYETSTEIREQRRIVEKPVVETEYREERVVVRKPVVEQMIRVDETTTYRPVLTTQNLAVPSTTLVPQVTGYRPQLKRLQRGYYFDPAVGQTVFRRGGLHWVQQPEVGMGSVPTVVQQQVSGLSYVPEKTRTETPVEITTYREEIQTRKIPVQVQRTVQEVVVEKIPVETRRPKVVTRTERVPYQETRYVEEEVVRRVPVTETIYQQVEQVEPYEVQVCSWEPVTREVQTPVRKWRLEEVDAVQNIPSTVMMRVPVDSSGVILGPPIAVDEQVQSAATQDSGQVSAESTATAGSQPVAADQRPELNPDMTGGEPQSSVLETSGRDQKSTEDGNVEPETTEFHGRVIELKKPASKLLFPEEDVETDQPVTDLVKISRATIPDAKDTRSGSDSAFNGDRASSRPNGASSDSGGESGQQPGSPSGNVEANQPNGQNDD